MVAVHGRLHGWEATIEEEDGANWRQGFQRLVAVVVEVAGGMVGRRWQRRKMARLEAGSSKDYYDCGGSGWWCGDRGGRWRGWRQDHRCCLGLRGSDRELQRKAATILARGQRGRHASVGGNRCCRRRVVIGGRVLAIVVARLRSLRGPWCRRQGVVSDGRALVIVVTWLQCARLQQRSKAVKMESDVAIAEESQ
ncbi:hypothetical protein B296_00041981 [Ensete ventricosum]|uniref:Uncharacterized protein n=1 Tax=Ensete ventricosum TaxID=4639 RepID=A0A426ZJT3_ENSVE|nr:hypothetical protein B296_00041981 [Ensete ventricosum]